MARFDWKKIQRWVIGAPRDPMHREQREGIQRVVRFDDLVPEAPQTRTDDST